MTMDISSYMDLWFFHCSAPLKELFLVDSVVPGSSAEAVCLCLSIHPHRRIPAQGILLTNSLKTDPLEDFFKKLTSLPQSPDNIC